MKFSAFICLTIGLPINMLRVAYKIVYKELAEAIPLYETT